jgi:hypothetical protein
MNDPTATALTADGGFLIADMTNNWVLFVDADLRFPRGRKARRGRRARQGRRAWGFYTTATDNLEKLPGLVSDIDPELGRQVAKSAGELHEEVARAPKSRAFNLRAKVGRRKRWYEVPDESIT